MISKLRFLVPEVDARWRKVYLIDADGSYCLGSRRNSVDVNMRGFHLPHAVVERLHQVLRDAQLFSNRRWDLKFAYPVAFFPLQSINERGLAFRGDDD